VALEALGCVIQELFRGVATLFRSASHDSYAILYYCVGSRASCAGNLVG
jgi:hypothetical protein